MDVLGGSHLVAIAGILGILPLWVTSEIEIRKGHSLQWLLSKCFPDESGTKIKVDDVILNIMAALKTRNTGDFSRQKVENIVCKVFRRYMKYESDRLFFDILVPDQNLYSVLGNHVQITSANEKEKKKRKGALFQMLPFLEPTSPIRNYTNTFRIIGQGGNLP